MQGFSFCSRFAFVQIGNIKTVYISQSPFLLLLVFLPLLHNCLMWAVKKILPFICQLFMATKFSNLYRPNNQTLVLIASIGLGTALITTLYFVQNLLINEVEITTDNDRPNLMVFDIQTYQKR